jgi:hypothetical protein
MPKEKRKFRYPIDRTSHLISPCHYPQISISRVYDNCLSLFPFPRPQKHPKHAFAMLTNVLPYCSFDEFNLLVGLPSR